ncbi:poly(ethylene terephthalate) hydrolase family protein [Salinimonas chungwhensis]|uniref:poly(ethylene terephthalate) hydrolase family protein n=1 Tax=Salinimonas chungwhensis TaxID=265425 RepID=UPI00037F17D5|nr:hypothetical protein [Salinimonas chungwhensis]
MKTASTLLLYCLTFSVAAEIVDQKTIDDGGSGPFKAIATSESSLSDYVVYRPKDLQSAAKQQHALPLIVFANGGCNDTSLPFERMLSEVASQGYLVVALGAMQRSLDDRTLKKSPNEQMPQAIDWAQSQNKTESSVYYNNIDTAHVAFAGQSCGGAQVLAMADEPRVTSYLMFNSGIGDMTMADADQQSLQLLHAPTLYLIGGESDVAYENALKDYQRITNVPVAFANAINAGHSGTFEEANGGAFARMALKWLDWQLKGKKENSAVFLKSDLSDFPGWTMKSKNF